MAGQKYNPYYDPESPDYKGKRVSDIFLAILCGLLGVAFVIAVALLCT